MAKLSVFQGGCWYCAEDEEREGLVFSKEFDTNLHISCLRKRLAEDPSDQEAQIIAREVLA